ncbi:RB-associated KRAB zinc finger protein-like isoform X2 [Ambystoma mexicanum]|uniref:RB-associated KRAB zinc finger protein-like isoform X2 n=1 Tax=Ambystoma mexicanum TaxID=8296 RepID=UPI0037E76CC5
MKDHRREMSQPSHESSFRDAAACFSDEEWNLLRDWQKDLYRNVMKEIHQALISLGPLIATTVSSLRAKEKQELCPVGRSDSRRRESMYNSPTRALNRGENQRLANPEDAVGEDLTNQSTGNPILNKDKCVRPEESSVIYIDPVGPEAEQRSANPSLAYPVVTAVFSLSANNSGKSHIREDPAGRSTANPSSNTAFSPRLAREKESNMMKEPTGRSAANPSSNTAFSPRLALEKESNMMKEPTGRCAANPASNTAFSPRLALQKEPNMAKEPTGRSAEIISIDEEDEENCPMEIQESETINDISIQTGEENMARDKAFGDSSTFSGKAFSLEPTKKMTPQSHMERNSRTQYWSLVEQDTAQCGSSSSNPEHINACVQSPSFTRPHTYSESEGYIGNSQYINSLPETQHNQTYTLPEHEQSCSPDGGPGGHTRTHSDDRAYACTECDMQFFEKSHLISHQRSHSEQKIFSCSYCYKSFNRKYNLDGHLRTHTGEKPYKCTECEKGFNWKSGYIRHLRTHSKTSIEESCKETDN